MSKDQTRRFLTKCEKGHKGQAPDIVWQRGRTGLPGSVIATSSATSRGIITLLNYDKYNPPQKESATSGATSSASSTATIEKESIKKQSKEVPQPSADASALASDKKNSKNGKNAKKRTDPRVKELIDYFCAAHEKSLGIKYVVSGQRDGHIFKSLLEVHEQFTIQQCVDLLFTDTDQWLNGKRTIPVLRSRINTYLQQQTRKDDDPYRPMTEEEMFVGHKL